MDRISQRLKDIKDTQGIISEVDKCEEVNSIIQKKEYGKSEWNHIK